MAWSCFGASDHGPVSFRRVGQSVDLPGKARHWGHDLRGSRQSGWLRHFYASVLLDAGESVKAVSEYLGHADPAFTLRTYTHLRPSSDSRTRSAVDALFVDASHSDGPKAAPDGRKGQ